MTAERIITRALFLPIQGATAPAPTSSSQALSLDTNAELLSDLEPALLWANEDTGAFYARREDAPAGARLRQTSGTRRMLKKLSSVVRTDRNVRQPTAPGLSVASMTAPSPTPAQEAIVLSAADEHVIRISGITREHFIAERRRELAEKAR